MIGGGDQIGRRLVARDGDADRELQTVDRAERGKVADIVADHKRAGELLLLDHAPHNVALVDLNGRRYLQDEPPSRDARKTLLARDALDDRYRAL